MIDLLVVLLALLVVALSLGTILLVLRQRRRARNLAQLQLSASGNNEKRFSNASAASHHRRIMVRPSESQHVYYHEKHFEASCYDSPPPSPLPEIHITFPEEVDASGKRLSGRVVVVHMSDTGFGLEPVESLPAYQQVDGARLESLDLERIGGLVEKARNAQMKK